MNIEIPQLFLLFIGGLIVVGMWLKILYKADKNPSSNIAYTKELLSFLDEFILNTFIRNMREFTDTHDIKAISKNNFEEFIKSTSEKIFQSINTLNIDISKSILSVDAIDWYIGENCIFIAKKLLDKSIDVEMDNLY